MFDLLGEIIMNTFELPDLPLLSNILKLNKDTVMSMLERMLTIRYTEQRIAKRVENKEVFTPCHLYIGQEACAVGVCFALKNTDYVFSTHRSHGHFLAKGGNINELFGEIYCRSTGCSGGHGGSMHLCNPSVGLLGSSSIVAGGLGIGLGPAFKSKVLREDNISVIFHGDCVPEEGIWHESLNFAAVMKLPVIYVCENNLYAASAPLKDRRLLDNIPQVAKAHGLHTEIVDGNDVFAMNKAAKEAVERIHYGKGPQFIEARTYRWLGHVGHRDDIDVGLRNAEELAYWKQRCPIKNLENKLVSEEICTEAELQKLQKKVWDKVDIAERQAIAAPKPASETLLRNIYSKGDAAEWEQTEKSVMVMQLTKLTESHYQEIPNVLS